MVVFSPFIRAFPFFVGLVFFSCILWTVVSGKARFSTSGWVEVDSGLEKAFPNRPGAAFISCSSD